MRFFVGEGPEALGDAGDHVGLVEAEHGRGTPLLYASIGI